MAFSSLLMEEGRKTFTENGATALNTSGNAILDMFATAGSLREADVERVERIFADAINEDKLLAAKALFYTRDVRGGLGERLTFRTMVKYAAKHNPEIIEQNIRLFGEYGRYDDLYCLVGTPLEKKMWEYVKAQLELDMIAMNDGEPCSLLAKWLKTADASSKATRKLGIKTAVSLGMSVYRYKRIVRALRKYIDVVEAKMSTGKWGEIEYGAVPSRAMTTYRNAFYNHDGKRFTEFLDKVATGEEKINAGTLFPYDLIGKYGVFGHTKIKEDPVVEAQWKALPDYIGEEANALVIADTSGSMYGRPIDSAVGLAIYFAERNKGAYHNMWMSFSGDSRVNLLKGETLAQKINSIDTFHWGSNTNLEAAFEKILDIAVRNNVPAEEMVKSLIIISDMEIDCCVSENWAFYDEMKSRFEDAGYDIPNVVFWNVDSRHDIFHADKSRKGVQLCSGQSASTFSTLMRSVGKTPTEMMLDVLNSDRYAPVRVS